jgi:protein gp37
MFCNCLNHKEKKQLMSLDTKIQWCDSTGNLQMGCEGCELVKGRVKPACYAKNMTDHYQGKKGWPDAFEKPKLFLERLPKIVNMPDLTGTNRALKPWLDKLPRIIFLNDMGDTFSKGMPENWFAEVMPSLSKSKHIYMLLTKWPKRMVKFSEQYPLPKNIWPGSSVTSNKTKFRAEELEQVKGGGVKWLSIEPMWGQINFAYHRISTVKLFIYGGESGSKNATPFNIAWLEDQIDYNKNYNRLTFIKQFGSNVYYRDQKLNFIDGHAGNWDEWPEKFRIREFPALCETQTLFNI